MKRFLLLSSALFFNTCFAQHFTSVFSSSFQFDEKVNAYRAEKQVIENGIVFIFDTMSKEFYKCTIKDGSFPMPPLTIGNDCWVALLKKGVYYHTSTFKMDSLALNSPSWFFTIEERKTSKYLFGSYFFGLSVPPFECGVVQFKKKYCYHRKGKVLVRKTERHYRSIPVVDGIQIVP